MTAQMTRNRLKKHYGKVNVMVEIVSKIMWLILTNRPVMNKLTFKFRNEARVSVTPNVLGGGGGGGGGVGAITACQIDHAKVKK